MAYNLSKIFSTHMHQLLIYYKYRKNTYQSVQNLYFIHYFATKISITFLAIKQPEVVAPGDWDNIKITWYGKQYIGH